jgi:16S rRNA (cytosine1402-N4)-methyltransferase
MSRPRSTPAGEHRAVLLNEVLACLDPEPGDAILDATVGWAGHAVELLPRVGPSGLLIGFDLDPENIKRASDRLQSLGLPFHLHQCNFAGLQSVMGERSLTGFDAVLADLGMSSMQVDDPERGFSYRRDGPLDMRMNSTSGQTAAQVLATIPERDLSRALKELGDEPAADRIAAAIVKARETRPLTRTCELAELILQAAGQKDWRLHPNKRTWKTHPAARTFQALRILVNRELANLEHLLRLLPVCLNPGGRAAIISFHSGEDRLVKAAFRSGLQAGIYADVSAAPVRGGWQERQSNPRSRSAKLRWAKKGVK